MPRSVEKRLSAVQVAQEREPGRYSDGDGLSLVVAVGATGKPVRSWVWRGTIGGKRVSDGWGPARLTTLAEAREKARHWAREVRDGRDPRKPADVAAEGMKFEDAAEQAYKARIAGQVRNAKHDAQWLSSLRQHTFPKIGNKPVASLSQADVAAALLPVWTTVPETARRVRQRIGAVMDWCIANGHREASNPVPGVERALPRQPRKVKHHASLDWQELPALMRRVEAMEGMGALALRFAILTAARSGEVRGATWSEIDLDERRWTIPAERMKAHRAHVVPLSDAALAVLAAVRPEKPEPGALAFPAPRGGQLSDMTLAAVLKRLEVPVTVHGFRSSFRTWAEESTSYPRSVVETALAHSAAENAVERAYLRSDLYVRRISLMDDWETAMGGK
jgi:integrase